MGASILEESAHFLKTEAAGSFQMLVPIQQMTWHRIQEQLRLVCAV